MVSGSPSPQTVDRWHAELRLFRLHRAAGGQARDGDMLHATLRFSGEAGLVALFARLERPLVALPADAPVPVAGQSYTLDEYEALRSPVRAYPRFENPSRTTLLGVSVHVTISEGEVGIALSGTDGDPYLVTDGDVAQALAIERALETRGLLPGGAPDLAASEVPRPLPRVSRGTIERLEDFPSEHVAARHIDVWLPPGYDGSKRCSVLYMHDGQMLFDEAITWNRQAWKVDVTIARLADQERIPETIVVGVWNAGDLRHSEYFPEGHLPFLPEAVRTRLIREVLAGKPRADDYLRFLVEELKPAIDTRYATRAEAGNTFIMGSSMGGLISVYAMNEYPGVFGGAAGLSTHWIGADKANAAIPLAAFDYLRDHLADPHDHRLYQDRGTTELDALYAPYQPFVDELARDRGYTETSYMSRVFEGTGHNENAWAARLEIPLLFLMGKR